MSPRFPMHLMKHLGVGMLVLALGMPVMAQSNYATPYTFTTIAGFPQYSSADGIGTAARFLGPYGIAVDRSGNVYVTDLGANTIRKIAPNGTVTTLAGTAGVSGSADGTGAAAQFILPGGVAVDGDGIVYVIDGDRLSRVRKITPDGVVTTIAGGLSFGSADGTGAAAQFEYAGGIAADSSGNLFVADYGNATVRKVTSSGVVTTFAGTAGVHGSVDGTGPSAQFNGLISGIAVDGANNVYVMDLGTDSIIRVRKITSAGVVTTLPNISLGDWVAADATGNLYVTNQSEVQKITPSGTQTTIAGTGIIGSADGPGLDAQFNDPNGIAIDSQGNVYVADLLNHEIRKITPSGVVTTLAGTLASNNYKDGTGSAARFANPYGIALDGSSNIYTDSVNAIRKVSSVGVVTTFAGSPYSIGSSDGTGTFASFYFPEGLASDGNGNIYVADSGSNTIRKISPEAAVTTLAGSPYTNSNTNPESVDGIGSAARFASPNSVAVDGDGNLYISDSGNYTIRKITSDGTVTTLAGEVGVKGSADGPGVAAQFGYLTGIAVDESGNIYVVDAFNFTIRKITPNGTVTTLAGTAGVSGSADGTGAAAQFNFLAYSGLAADRIGNLFVADSGNSAIRKVTPDGVVTTIAGGTVGSTDGTGANAQFGAPSGVAVDSNGTVYVTDFVNNTIRKGVPAAAPSITTQPTNLVVKSGGSITFSVEASGAFPFSFQWYFDGTPIPGATSATFSISSVHSSDQGTYTVNVSNYLGVATSSAATLTVSTTRLINISTRAQVGTGGNILIPGFVVGGNGTETLLIRAVGPGLSQFGVTGVLAQPSLSVTNSAGTVVASNTGWGTNANPAQIASVATQVGAFSLLPGSADCATIVSLPPGAYTVQVPGIGNTTGVALAEVYEVSSSGTRLINISTRAQVGTGGNIMIAGFVVSGSGTEQLLVRGDGPSLTQFSVTGVLAQPSLSVFDSTGKVIATNTGWGTNGNPAQIASTASSVGAFSLASGSGDSAQVISLSPGAYTMQVSGVSSTTGVALAEIYEVP